MWSIGDISFEIADEITEWPILTIAMLTPAGELLFTGEPEIRGRVLVVHGAHVQGSFANRIGAANLLVLAQALMERMGYDELVVEGAVRTSGANPEHTPRIMRFSRRVHADDCG